MRAARVVSLGLWVLAAGPVAAESARVVLLPVVVNTASPDPTYVSRGISDMLSARLEQLGGVEVIQVDDPAAATSRLEPALELGRGLGADYVLYGSFTQFGDGASLDMQCASVADSGGDRDRNIFIQSGTMGDLIPKLDQLADKVVRFVGGAPTSEAAVPAAPSADALKDLRERLEVLERTVFTPVAGAASEPEPELVLPES
jgi:TolB-like protein